MKVFSVLLIIVFCLTTNIFSQVQFASHIITTSADGANSVYAVDVDGDGDMDVLSASINDGKIAWYENDGSENFTTRNITTGADGPTFSLCGRCGWRRGYGCTFRGFFEGKIAWYENDGNENFTPHTITTGVNAISVYTADMDGDTDMDILSTSRWLTIWLENDGNENFTLHAYTSRYAG